MRWMILSFCVILSGIVFSGCGDSGSTPTAAAPSAPPGGPPMPGGPPAPGASSNPGGDGAPAANAPPEGTPNEGAPGAPGGDGIPMPTAPGEPPGGGNQFAGGGTDGPPPGDPNNPNNGQPGNESPDGSPPPPPPPRTLREQAIAAFRNGNELMGTKLLNAHFAAVPKAKDELAQKMAWYPGLMRPALAPRIGIAIQIVEEPLNFKGDPMPIGSTALTTAVDQMQQAEAADGAIGRTGRMSKFGRGRKGPMADFSEKSKTDQTQNWPPAQQITYYVGDFGDWLLEALHERMETGDYGPMLQDLVKQARRPVQRRDPNNPDGQPGDGGSGSAGGQADEGGAPPPGGGRGGRGGRGGGGAAFGAGGGAAGAGFAASGADSARRWSSKTGSDREAANLVAVKQVSPYILWLGKIKDDERDELNKRAEATNCDVLAVFTMKLHQARTGNFINNTSTLRIYCYRPGNPPATRWQPLPGYSAEPLVNLDVERWRQKDEKGMEPVEREILKALEALDKVLKPVPLPEALTAERAKKRITDLVAAKPDEPLPVVVEARYYMAKGLLSQSDFIDAAKTLLGEDGLNKLAARDKD